MPDESLVQRILNAVGPQEAEASPAGIFEKAAITGAEKASSAAKRLIGKTIQNKVIKDVLKGDKNWRKILFEDGTQMVVDKKYIHDLTRAVGTKEYVQRFKEAGEEARTMQALRSMKMHESRVDQHPFGPQATRHMHEKHLGRVAEYGDKVAATAFVKRGQRYFQMPLEYATHLEELGVLRIVRGSEERKILERFGVDVERRRKLMTPGGESEGIKETGRRRSESAWPRTNKGRRRGD